MYRSINRFLVIPALLSLLFTSALTIPIHGGQKEKAGQISEQKEKRFPFNGKLHSVDMKAMSITLTGKTKNRTLSLMKSAKIAKDGKPAGLKDAIPGEVVAGLLVRHPDGREEIQSLRLGPKPEKTGKPQKSNAPKKEDAKKKTNP
jgi:hypothetical protein